MKKPILTLLAFISSASAYAAAPTPALYCISSHPIQGSIMEVHVFSDAKGVVRVNAQAIASQEGDIADTDYLYTSTASAYNPATKTLIASSANGGLSITLAQNPIDPTTAYALMRNCHFNEGDPKQATACGSGFQVRFSRFYRAKMNAFAINAKKGTYGAYLNAGFAGGLNDYVCADNVDYVKAKK